MTPLSPLVAFCLLWLITPKGDVAPEDPKPPYPQNLNVRRSIHIFIVVNLSKDLNRENLPGLKKINCAFSLGSQNRRIIANLIPDDKYLLP